jgi:molybdopterin-guanine dinucleotide biosynthesis protein A
MSQLTSPPIVVGILVGGRGSRLGGIAKGNMTAPGSTQTLIERLLGEVSAAASQRGLDVETLLVGAAAAYSPLGVTAIADEPAGIGPLGGLNGLLSYAEKRGATQVLALACDLPHLGAGLLARLLSEAPDAGAVLALQGELRNPLIARYAVGPTRLAVLQALGVGRHSLQAVLDRLDPPPHPLDLSAEERSQLGDWDTPADLET